MKIVDSVPLDVQASGDQVMAPRTGLIPSTLPKVHKPQTAKDSDTGVSTRNAILGTATQPTNFKEISHWYALRATYGRELKACNYLISKGVVAYCPTISVVKEFKGKRRTLIESRLPNIFFAYGTEEQIKKFVYDNVNLPYLRFYYQHIRCNNKVENLPLVVPDAQMKSLKIICEAEANDLIISPTTISKFEAGQLVRVVDGPFNGVVGKVARYQGQQRVAITISGLFTVCSAYIPKAFIKLIQ